MEFLAKSTSFQSCPAYKSVPNSPTSSLKAKILSATSSGVPYKISFLHISSNFKASSACFDLL